ncbi:uncharacterized protein LOC132903438 [Amyelois transitella]|uniref:uncharacterized protein LOC132903438 n=1 Tax=Amyelois transitella TaxID=680683 RepID=UPI00298F96E9|nr:uncharacterized protein LOC132903438 [Amyelois transitella]
MAIGVDSSKWKPRSILGTPAAKFRNYLAVGVISFGIISGLIFHYIPTTKNLRAAITVLYEDPIQEVERKRIIASGMRFTSAESIRKEIEESKRFDRPDR